MQPGFRKEVREIPFEGGKETVQLWQLVQWGRVVAEGAASSPEVAERFMADALSAKVGKLQEAGDAKKEHRARIRYHMTRRPYCTLGMVRKLLSGVTNLEQLVREAAEQEEYEWKWDDSPVKAPLKRAEGSGRQPMAAGKVVEQLWESMVVCGMISDPPDKEARFMPLGKKWAFEMFGKEEFGL
jgi:hypothetical protein